MKVILTHVQKRNVLPDAILDKDPCHLEANDQQHTSECTTYRGLRLKNILVTNMYN